MARDIIVIGASSGGTDALRVIAGGLPKTFQASVFVVVHTAPGSPGILDGIIDKAGPLPAEVARDNERIRRGHIYIAPPDHHLMIEPGVMRLTRGPSENCFRPAVDPLFRSAAQVYGPRVVGVILTGALDDGTAGLWTVKQLGGIAIVQDPEDAMVESMPRSALKTVRVDYCVPVAEIAGLLTKLVDSEPPAAKYKAPAGMDIEVKIAKEGIGLESGVLKLGEPSNYTCPECHGVLLKLEEENRVRFRCHTGHAFSLENLMAAVTQGVEDAVWNAIRSIEEKILLMRHFAAHLGAANFSAQAALYLRQVEETQNQVDLLRSAILKPKQPEETRIDS